MANIKTKIKKGILIAGIGLLGASCANKDKQATVKENTEPEPVKTEYVAPVSTSETQKTTIHAIATKQLHSRSDSLEFAKGGWEFLSPEQHKIAQDALEKYTKAERALWEKYKAAEKKSWAAYKEAEKNGWALYRAAEKDGWAIYRAAEKISEAEASAAWKTKEKIERDAWKEKEKIERDAWKAKEQLEREAWVEKESELSGPFALFWNTVIAMKNQVHNKLNQIGDDGR
jgi:hypothetical protein